MEREEERERRAADGRGMAIPGAVSKPSELADWARSVKHLLKDQT